MQVPGFRVRLDSHGAKPPVWRHSELPSELRLPRFHDVIQAAMGWSDSHLHRFRTGSSARKGDELWYEYDFGEGWDHKLVVEPCGHRPRGDAADLTALSDPGDPLT